MKMKLSINNVVLLVLLWVNLLTRVNVGFYEIIADFIPYFNLLLLLLLFLTTNRSLKRNEMIFLVMSFGILGAVIQFNGTSFGAYSSFLCVFLTIYIFYKINLNKFCIKIIFYTFCIILAIGLICAPNGYIKFENQENVMNPNVIGINIYLAFILIVAFGNIYSLKKMHQVMLWIICLVGEVLLKARTSMIVLFIIGIIYFCIPRKYMKRKSAIIIFGCVIILGCVFPLIYLSLRNTNILNMLIYQLTGKTWYSGREIIWKRFFEALFDSMASFWIGPGSHKEYAIGRGLSMHNSYLAIMLNFGVLGVFLYLIFVLLFLKKIYKNPVNNIQMTFLLGYLGILIMGFAEVSIQTPYLLIQHNMLLGLARNKDINDMAPIAK